MATSYTITFERVDYKTMLLTYVDHKGTVKSYFEHSAVPQYDWIGDEPDFCVPPERLAEILPRVHEWAASENLVLKIWRADELGV